VIRVVIWSDVSLAFAAYNKRTNSAGRAALNWTVRDLAKAISLHRNTITNTEVSRHAEIQEAIALMKNVFREAGVEVSATEWATLS
jgi:hypothetical protein